MRSFPLALILAALAAPVGARADVTIAVAGPMTGSSASGGEQFRQGAEAAVADINKAGGLLGQRVALMVADDACDPKQAVAVANQITARRVPFVFGHYCSGSTIPASLVYAEENTLQITISSNPLVTERGISTLFRLTGRDDQQGAVAVKFLTDHFPGKKVAVVDDQSTFGRGLAVSVGDRLAAEGKLPVVLRASIVAGERDFSALVSRLKSAGAEIVYFGGYHTEAGLILRQGREAGARYSLFGADPLATTEFSQVAGAAAEGTLYTFSPDPRLDPKAAELTSRFRAAGVEPEGYVLYAYAGVQLYANAVARAGSLEARKVAATLHAGGLSTFLGPISFDAKGDNTEPGYRVYRWTGGKSSYAD